MPPEREVSCTTHMPLHTALHVGSRQSVYPTILTYIYQDDEREASAESGNKRGEGTFIGSIFSRDEWITIRPNRPEEIPIVLQRIDSRVVHARGKVHGSASSGGMYMEIWRDAPSNYESPITTPVHHFHAEFFLDLYDERTELILASPGGQRVWDAIAETKEAWQVSLSSDMGGALQLDGNSYAFFDAAGLRLFDAVPEGIDMDQHGWIIDEEAYPYRISADTSKRFIEISVGSVPTEEGECPIIVGMETPYATFSEFAEEMKKLLGEGELDEGRYRRLIRSFVRIGYPDDPIVPKVDGE